MKRFTRNGEVNQTVVAVILVVVIVIAIGFFIYSLKKNSSDNAPPAAPDAQSGSTLPAPIQSTPGTPTGPVTNPPAPSAPQPAPGTGY